MAFFRILSWTLLSFLLVKKSSTGSVFVCVWHKTNAALCILSCTAAGQKNKKRKLRAETVMSEAHTFFFLFSSLSSYYLKDYPVVLFLNKNSCCDRPMMMMLRLKLTQKTLHILPPFPTHRHRTSRQQVKLTLKA